MGTRFNPGMRVLLESRLKFSKLEIGGAHPRDLDNQIIKAD